MQDVMIMKSEEFISKQKYGYLDKALDCNRSLLRSILLMLQYSKMALTNRINHTNENK